MTILNSKSFRTLFESTVKSTLNLPNCFVKILTTEYVTTSFVNRDIFQEHFLPLTEQNMIMSDITPNTKDVNKNKLIQKLHHYQKISDRKDIFHLDEVPSSVLMRFSISGPYSSSILYKNYYNAVESNYLTCLIRGVSTSDGVLGSGSLGGSGGSDGNIRVGYRYADFIVLSSSTSIVSISEGNHHFNTLL